MTVASTDSRGSLRSASFTGLLLTQFLGAFNDNMFRWLAVPIGQQILPSENAATMSLALGGVCFTIPYLVMVATAGSLADKFSKRSVIVGCKIAEIVVMALGIVALVAGNVWLLFTVVMLMGAQSALFGPAKFGSLPEMLDSTQLSKGNGLMGLVTVVASALGTVAGFRLFGLVETRGLLAGAGFSAAWPAGMALVGVAILGTLTSLWIKRLVPANPDAQIKFNPIRETLPALKLLASDRALIRTAFGIGFFWFLASLSQLNIDPFGDEILGMEKEDIGILLAILVAGLGAGSVLAGWWSGGKVELGIVPLGTLGVIVTALMLYVVGSNVDPAADAIHQPAFWWTCFWLFQLGAAAGLFNVPLEAFLQHRSDERQRGTILAAANFVSFSLILFSCGLFYFLRLALNLSPAGVFMVAGLGTIPVAIYVFRLLPDVTVRFLFWLSSRTIYRLRVRGAERIPEQGGALLVANHVSWVDGILVLVSSSRMVRFLVYADYTEKPFLAWLARIMRVIPIKANGGPKAIVRSLQSAKQAIQDGELVCIFAEGQLTRTGQMQPFQPGLMRIVGGTGAPVIPVYLHGLWGSIFSYRGGRFFWKIPKKWPYPVSIHFGKPIPEPDDVCRVRQAVEQLGVEAVTTDTVERLIPARQFVRQCKRTKSRVKIADSSGLELTGGKLLAGTIAMQRVLTREVLAGDEQMVGVLVPPSCGGAIANVALALAGRTSANLNYTMTDDVKDYCIKQAGIRHVITSRKFLEKSPVTLKEAELVYLEDLKDKVTGLDKFVGALAAYALPAGMIDRLLGLNRIGHEELLTIIFTSGSTGRPKGVMLTQANIGSNIDAVDDILNLKSNDVLLGVLPFFHSFGYTASLWLVMAYEPKAVYHYNPLDARMVGKLCEKHNVTILMSTPTFLRAYLRRVEPEQMKHLDLVVTGAEKLPIDLAEEFQQKFGVLPSEGYGTTELSPAVAINIPDHRSPDVTQVGTKLGTIGRPLPGVAAKIVDPDTWEDQGIDREGLLLIKGPNVMLGYLNDPEKTAEVIRDGWYNTGDWGSIDADGFITITGRLSRFSKIGGEMVPHIGIEEAIAKFVSADSAEEPNAHLPQIAVTAVPDAKKGERIVVLHTRLTRSKDEIRKALSEAGLPNIWIPATDSFLEVDEIPLLGTGKLDLRALKEIALGAYATAESQSA